MPFLYRLYLQVSGKEHPHRWPPSDRIFPETIRYPPLIYTFLPAERIGRNARTRLLSPARTPDIPEAFYGISVVPVHDAAGGEGANNRQPRIAKITLSQNWGPYLFHGDGDGP